MAHDSAEVGAVLRREPVRLAMAKMAVGLRCGVGAVGIVSALIGFTATRSPGVLAVVLVPVAAWTAWYARRVWTRGLSGWVIAVDVGLTCGVCVVQWWVLPPAAVPGGASWVNALAAMTVICAQLHGHPLVSIPAGLLVTVAYGIGSDLAGIPAYGIMDLITLVVQTVAAAATMVVAVRTGGDAATAFGQLQEEQRAAAIASAERAAALSQLRLLHNGPLTTLTMAIHTDSPRATPTLRRRAAADLGALSVLESGDGAGEELVRLDEQLAQVSIWYEPQLRVSARLAEVSLPQRVADAFLQAVREALENVLRHAGTGHAMLELGQDADRTFAVVSDQGRGFGVEQRIAAGFGLREAVIGTMTTVDGTATIASTLGKGTSVRLEWRRAQPVY
ncbi:ATP-binding protein [Acrocarpospora sp. B8E8]|uniref:sensor histidine kinase n=1 Tax=Acrocarpospora sp. B8E8 TaxID=3153572 RepID=UPI00325DE2B6